MADPHMTSSYFARRSPLNPISSADVYQSPYFQLPSWFRAYQITTAPQQLTEESSRRLQEEYERQRLLSAPGIPGGTILHKGFYDLLALSAPVVQTVSKFWYNSTPQDDRLVAGAPYNQLPRGVPPQRVDRLADPLPLPPQPVSYNTNPPAKKGRRVSKDMISNPMGFKCVSPLSLSSSLTLK